MLGRGRQVVSAEHSATDQAVPPPYQGGGTERVVALLTQAMVHSWSRIVPYLPNPHTR